jgi:hypothetical protein
MSVQNQKSSLETSSMADTEIFTAHRLQQNQKSLMKTESLQTQKSSPETSSTADTEIFTAYRLLQNQKSLKKNCVVAGLEIITGNQFYG